MGNRPQTVRALLRDTVARFRRAKLHYGHGTHNASDEAAWLILHILGVPYDKLPQTLDRALKPAELQKISRLVELRVRERTPVAYLTHEAWLGAHRFYVDRRVIVPRSFIAELLRDDLSPWVKYPRRVREVLDMCTGSGCLAILAALAFPESHVDAVDISAAALAVARRNLRDYRLTKRIRLVKSDLFRQVEPRQYDLILANPPYVNAASMRRLPDEFRHEPELALASGQDGLDAVHAVLVDAKRFLKPKGVLVVEVGHNRKTLERTCPRLDFTWLGTSAGEDYVFLLRKEQLP